MQDPEARVRDAETRIYQLRSSSRMRRLLGRIGTGAWLGILSLSFCGFQSATRSTPETAVSGSTPATPADDLQLSYKIDQYKEVSDSGPERGENIYWHKCWVCHNKYQKTAPPLEGVFKLTTLVTGAAVNDKTVTAQIKDGGPGMPSFRTTLSDSDVADVVSYLHSEKCCVEGETLPANPWYRAETNKWAVQSGLSGGPKGTVRIASGDSPEGVMVS